MARWRPKAEPSGHRGDPADPAKVQVSAVSAWEITTKARIGKLPDALDVAADVAGCLAARAFSRCH